MQVHVHVTGGLPACWTLQASNPGGKTHRDVSGFACLLEPSGCAGMGACHVGQVPQARQPTWVCANAERDAFPAREQEED